MENTESTHTAINVSWSKPLGGDAITTYNVSYKAHDVENYTSSNSVSHIASQSLYSTIIGDLYSGQLYNVKVWATNGAGEGEPATESLYTGR